VEDVNEAYLRLVDIRQMQWQNRAHFFAVSAQLMRRVLVDYARRHNLKRGGDLLRVSLRDDALVDQVRDLDLVTLDGALTALAVLDTRKAQIVEMRFFGGLSVEESCAFGKPAQGQQLVKRGGLSGEGTVCNSRN
jgi:RNA polymerase sigma factor (TIGR02999 family)